ncbi:hypothetical protein TUMSATVNIG1_13510 [Vibrio nigripulchritudo]|nr:hypothetical protein VNTUMSATTG_13400 [Vibrio nigripulchritudo]BDU30742.1 hypothetical protein TUMSATVNIG1_13510 [Vibrio nigripulchritudo]BDU36898.1 hypothetical protein TUMSATVNIG2_13670 [Vibrio nigripulchritudo]
MVTAAKEAALVTRSEAATARATKRFEIMEIVLVERNIICSNSANYYHLHLDCDHTNLQFKYKQQKQKNPTIVGFYSNK